MSIGIRSLDDLFDRCIPEPNSGCWLWEGYIQPNGYSRPGAFGRYYLGHRLAYELAKGPIPNGMQIDHRCRIRCCVNPDHLRILTCQQNLLCGETLASENAAKTHCLRDHEFTETNTRMKFQRGYWHRACRECGREEVRARRRRQKS